MGVDRAAAAAWPGHTWAKATTDAPALVTWMVFSSGSFKKYGSVSKPCTPGEHQNSW